MGYVYQPYPRMLYQFPATSNEKRLIVLMEEEEAKAHAQGWGGYITKEPTIKEAILEPVAKEEIHLAPSRKSRR